MDSKTPLLTKPLPTQGNQKAQSSPHVQTASPTLSYPFPVMDDVKSQEIEIDQDLQLSIHAYKRSSSKVVLANLSYTLSGGIVWILARWFPKLKLSLNYDPCPMSIATHVYIENQWEEGVIAPVSESSFSGKISDAFPKTRNNAFINVLRTFEYRYIRFIFSPHSCEFVPNDIWRDSKWESMDRAFDGILDSGDLARRQVLFKSNNLQIKEKPTSKILIDEVLHPFFLFQIASIILWSVDNYYYYASVILLISIASILATLYETKLNMRKLRRFSTFSCTMKVWRFGAWITLDSADLVPGDVFEVTPGIITDFPADAVLLNGDCIVNESMLTGESLPVSKSPIAEAELRELDFEKEDPAAISSMSRYFLFSGTKIIRSRASAGASNSNFSFDGVEAMKSEMRVIGALAMVVRTGFNTTKGNLIRSMLFPKPNKFKFYRDSFRFIGVLALIAGIGFIVSFYNFLLMGVSWALIFVRALDLITIVVPPALPATMAIGTSFAISRLKKGLIYCISPPRVNICGKIDLMCFDKTGTLTEEGLDVLGFRFTVPSKDTTSWTSQMLTSASSPNEGSCRFSRLYTQAEEVVPRPILEQQNVGSPNSEALSLTKISGVSLKYGSIPGHPNAEKEYEYPLIICAMATCHSIKVVDGDLVGDPLDLKMFTFTGWEISENAAVVDQFGHIPLVEPRSSNISSNNYISKIGVVRTFDFVSSLRRMSVIIKRYRLPSNSSLHIISEETSSEYEVFVKGAPEVMEMICDPYSIPSNYNEQLRYYSHHGYRVIAIGHNTLSRMSPSDVHDLRRSTVEENIRFLGFIIFENKLKPGTASVVKELNDANIRQVMVTGDNVLTSISVSRACGLVSPLARIYIPRFIHGSPIDPDASIVWENVDEEISKVDPISYMELFLETPEIGDNPIYNSKYQKPENAEYFLAITGEVFSWMLDFASEESIQKMLIKCQIFARMSPDQKHFLVERFQELGYCVGFTGDGSNDCGALKNADVGLSLSEAEASVAAPFTSQSKDLSCVLRIIREGRAALVTSFSCFKYMALYSLIQFTSVSLLYSQGNNLGDFQFLYIDIFIVIPIAIFMGRSGPHSKICKKRPTASLMSKYILTSLVGQIALQVIFQFWLFHWIQAQSDWYRPGIKEEDAMFPSMENTALFYLSTFQYMTVAFVYNTGAPYRENSIKNIPFVINFVFLWGFTAYIAIWEPLPMMDILELVSIPLNARLYIIGLIFAHFLVSWICEAWIFKKFSKLFDWIRWSIISLQRRSAMEAADHIDLTRWKRRLKWQERGKIFRLVADDLNPNRTDGRIII